MNEGSTFSRILGVILASFAVLAVAPVIVVIGLAVKVSSRGPIFSFRQRITRDGGVIKILTFRSLDPDRDPGVAVLSGSDDPRRTRIGNILYRTTLDELPTLLQVAAGQLTFTQLRTRHSPLLELPRESLARPKVIDRAARVFEIVGALVPKRLGDEEIGDALEVIGRMERDGRANWVCWIKVASTTFWVAINAVREIRRSWQGK